MTTDQHPSSARRPPCGADDRVEDAYERSSTADSPRYRSSTRGTCCVGLFGEREFMAALFPGYVGELHYAGVRPGLLDEVLEKRAACRVEHVSEHMNTDHVAVARTSPT